MLPPIPREVLELYSGLRWWERLHIRLRWRLCPFVAIAGFVPPAARVADIGCGRGMLANYLALGDPSREVTGIDRQESRLRAALATVGDRPNIRFRAQDARELEGESLDVAILSDMLHHLDYPDQESLLRSCHRMLRPGGLLLLEDVCEIPRWKFFSHYLIDRTLNKGRGQKFRKLQGWRELLERIGFAVETRPAHQGIPLSDHLFICRKPSA